MLLIIYTGELVAVGIQADPQWTANIFFLVSGSDMFASLLKLSNQGP